MKNIFIWLFGILCALLLFALAGAQDVPFIYPLIVVIVAWAFATIKPK